MVSEHQVIIVGLGLAGLSAARTLQNRRLDVLLLDENNSPGGQYLRSVSRWIGIDSRPIRENLKRVGHRLVRDLNHAGMTVKQGTQTVGLEADGSVWTLGKEGRIEKHHADHIILATGARERFLPFPGWTLPGVISTGAAQILVKSAGILPGRNPIVGGAGPLPLALAGEIYASGGRVRAYWNQSSWSQQLHTLKGCRYHLSKVTLGMRCLTRLVASRTPLLHGYKVLEARGNNVLEEVALAAIDHDGHVIQGSEKTFDVDCLAVGYGFVPNLELAMLAGCELRHDIAKGGWVVKVEDNLQSSVPPIIAAGELTGIAGAEKSIIDGCLAGLSVAGKLGALNNATDKAELEQLQKRRQREIAFGALLNSLCETPSGLFKDLPDQTMICRCEDINLGQIRKEISNGVTQLDAMKKATNCGMGKCQGRTCGPIIQEILTAHAQATPEDIRPYSVRNPIKPVPLSALAESNGKELS